MKREDREPDATPEKTEISFRREPPVAAARVAVLKANYKQAWLYFLLVICLIFAWGIPLRHLLMQRLTFRGTETGPRDAYEFMTLAFVGLSDNPEEVTPEKFRSHLDALREAGYQPVTLEEVHALYAEGTPLPRNAMLLTFDQSRKSSYFVARTPLRRAGWNAVMFLWTRPILEEDPAALRWPYVRSMLRSGAWEAGAQSHRGFSQVRVDGEGGMGNFLTTPRWLLEEGRFEAPETFGERMRADHERTVNTIRRNAGVAPRAFAYPYGDFGQYDERALLTRRLNMELVDEYYDLGFILGNTPLNTRHTDPRRLNRLMVRPEWSSGELIRRLEHAKPRRETVKSPDILREELAWLKDWGEVSVAPEGLQLSAAPSTTGAKVWLNGSGLFRDFQARLRFRPPTGQLGLFLRASPDGEAHLYLGLGAGGDVWLRQKEAGMEPVTVGSGRYTPGEDGLVDLRVNVRGGLLYASVDDAPLFDEVIRLRGRQRPGMLGFSVWHPEAGLGEVELLEVTVEPFDRQLVQWAPVSSRQPVVADWFSRHAYRYTHMAPPWLLASREGRSEQAGWNPGLYQNLRDMYEMKFMPEIVVEHLEVLDGPAAARFVQMALEDGADGLFCNLAEVRGRPSAGRVSSWIQHLRDAAVEEEMSLMVRLPAGLERDTTISSLAENLPELEIVVVPGGETRVGERLRNERVIPLEQVSFEHRAFPLFRQLEGGDAPVEADPVGLHEHKLRQDGMAAYRRGDVDRAMELWGLWRQRAPMNAEPYVLMGEVHFRKGEYEEAVNALKAGLDLSPGQTGVVLKLAEIYERHLEAPEKADGLLSTYANLFPQNVELALAHGRFLLRTGRPEEANALVGRIVEEHPEDLEALALLHGFLEGPWERVENLNRILAIAEHPGMGAALVETIHRHDLLRWPESWRLYGFLEREEEASQELLPRGTISRTAFSNNANGVFGDWEVSDAEFGMEDVGAFHSEVSVRLDRSTGMRNGFVEARIEDPQGVFWIYARRSDRGQVRFGFDHTDQLFLQIWQDGELLANQQRPWRRPHGESFRLRVEIRGDGAYGYVDGKPAFGSPVLVPDNLGHGWWGVGPWSSQLGVAHVRIRDLAGGPLPVKMVMFRPRPDDWSDSEMLEALQGRAPEIAVVSPPWFRQDAEGRVISLNSTPTPELTVLGRLHAVRLYPVIRGASWRTLDPEELLNVAREHQVRGFVLLFGRMPPEEWFMEMEDRLLEMPLTLLAVSVDEAMEEARVREISGGTGLFAGARRPRSMRLRIERGEEAGEEWTWPPQLPDLPERHSEVPPNTLILVP